MSAKERLGSATRRVREDEIDEDDAPPRARVGATKRTLSDLAFGPIVGAHPAAASSRLPATMFRPPEVVAGDALRLAEDMLARSGIRAVRVDRRAQPAAGRAEPDALAAAMTHVTGCGSGERLPAQLAALMGARLGADLSAIRVHHDDAAHRAATALGAEAFTLGDHVYFARGCYQPESEQGLRLLAHEVAHAVQQRSVSRGGALEASMPDDLHEGDADAFAARMVREIARTTSASDLRDPADAVEHARSAGVPIDLPFKEEMERHFGVSFDHVKAFSGPAAELACQVMSATAFAIHDIVVLADPSPKRELLLHELTHIMQMGNRRAPSRFTKGSVGVSAPDSAAEQEAHHGVVGGAYAVAPQNEVRRATNSAPTADPADTSKLEDRVREFRKKQKLDEFPKPEERPFGFNPKTNPVSWPMYRWSLPRPFHLRDYREVVDKSFPGAKSEKDLVDLFSSENDSLREEVRISRVDTESSPSYVVTGAQQKYGKVVYDHRPRTAPKDSDQFPAYARYVTAIKAKPSKALATFEADPADEETAKQYRERLRTALADHYGPLKDGWKVFHAEIVLDTAIFGSPHQRIQGDAFAEIVAKTPLKTSDGDSATATAVEPQFQPSDLAKLGISDKVFARGDGYVNTTLQPATRTIMAECKAVTGPPSAENKAQIAAYAKVTDKASAVNGYFSQPQEINKQNVKQVQFDHVAFFFSFGDSPQDKQAATAWKDAIHAAFGDDLKRFSIVPPPDGKQIYEIQLNPTFRFQATDANAKTHRFTEPMQRHAGVKFKHVTIQAEEPGSPKVAGGSVAFDLDMAGAMQAKNVEKKIDPQAGSAGRVDNKFTGFKSQLDKVLGKVETDAKLTDDGITATLKLQKGAAKIPGFKIDDVELTATLNGDGNLTIAGLVALTHNNGKISGTVGVKWEGAWVFTGTVKVAAGTIDGLNEFDASITYGNDKLVIGADNVALEKTFKGVKLTGSVRGLTYDVKKESFSGFARIDADLGAFGSASAEGELEHNKLKRAEFSYDSPELVYPAKSKSPVFKGTVGGTITYSEGKLSGRIRGTADMNVPLLQKLGNKEGLGLAVDARIGEDGSYSGSIRSTKPIQLGDHFRIPKLVANLEADGTADAQFSIEIVKVKWLDNAKIGCAIDKNGFRVTDANIEKTFGEKGKDKVAGAIRVNYAEDKGLLIGGDLSIKVREGFVATGTFTYNHETKKVSAELTTEEIHLIKMEPINKLLFEVKRKIPIFNVWGIGVYVDIGFDLSFNMDFNLSMKPTVGLEDLSLETFDYKEITAKIDFIGALVAALVGTPKAGLGIFVLSPDLLSGGGGLEVPISGKLELKPSGGFTLRYKPGEGVEGGAKLGLALTFGITGAVVPYAEFSVLKDTYNPKWKGEPLKEFTILPPRDLLNISLDLGGDLSKPGKVQLPEKDTVAESAEPQGDRTFKSEPAKEEKKDVPATAPAPVEKPPADPGKTSPGFDIDMLMGALEGFGPVQTLKKIVNTAAEVWEKIKGAIGYIVKIVKNWFNSAVEAIEGVMRGIAEKGLVRYLGDVVKEKIGERPYRIIQPLFDRFATVEDKIMSLLDEPFPSSIGEAPGWIWRIFKKLLDIGWSSISALVSAVSEIASNLADAVGDLLTWAVERGMIGVQRHAYWVGVPYVSEYHFLAATEYKIDILGSGIYFKDEGMLNNPKSAVGIALFEVLEAWDVPATYTEVEEDSGEPYNDRWVGDKGAL
jgi:hypothetical protein